MGRIVSPTWTVEKVTLDVRPGGQEMVPYDQAQLHPDRIEQINNEGGRPAVDEEYAYEEKTIEPDSEPVEVYYHLTAKSHWRWWSMLPAVTAVLLCWLTREPLTSVLGGSVGGAML
ncbi:MAG: hypothetical protein IID32_10325, partial [Planctomycetes bacterium]|nr:hypothetical protein [Planctomycetota bacterium]